MYMSGPESVLPPGASSGMFWGPIQSLWLGFAEPLYKEAGAKAPASLNF